MGGLSAGYVEMIKYNLIKAVNLSQKHPPISHNVLLLEALKVYGSEKSKSLDKSPSLDPWSFNLKEVLKLLNSFNGFVMNI
jgi:hypothetical protein